MTQMIRNPYLWAMAFVLATFVVPWSRAESSSCWVYVGTYTGPKSKGIYVMKMDLATGKLSEPKVAGEVESPSFLAIHPTEKFLYAANETSKGNVTAFSIAADTGMLTLLNQQPSNGDGPCWVSLDPSGKTALVANYGSGVFESLPVGDDGKLGAPASIIQDSGPGSDPSKKSRPHAHSLNADPAGKFAFGADLGLDKVFSFKLDPSTGKLTANEPAFVSVAAGAGPRHLAFHPNGKFAYVINELNSTLGAFNFDSAKGTLSEIQVLSTLPADFHGKNSTAEVQVHPSGKFVYGSNRGHNSIAVFTVDEQTGKLTPAGEALSGGKIPRNFRIDPTGNFLLAAHQDSDSVVAFKIDQKTGALIPTGQTLSIGSPVCVKFVSMK